MKLKPIPLGFGWLFLAMPLVAQVNLSTLPYTQTFNVAGLTGSSGAWTDNATVPGWYAGNTNVTTTTFAPYAAWANTAGGANSSATFYSMGTSSSAADRAVGGAASTVAYTMLGLRLANDTGSPFNDLLVKYDLEQWSDRGTARVTLSYQVFGAGSGSLNIPTGWTVFSTASSPLPVNGSPVSGIGNTTGLLSSVGGGIGSLGIPSGNELWLRWEITKIAGQNSTHGIDNVALQVPEPCTLALFAIGALGLAFCQRRSPGEC